jgi:hypothetical protein
LACSERASAYQAQSVLYALDGGIVTVSFKWLLSILRTPKGTGSDGLPVHRALTEITGLSGLRIFEAILRGARDRFTLAALEIDWLY